MADDYIPERGDFARLVLDPYTGCEQGGERPVLVLSTQEFNATTRYALVAPIMRTIRNWPFELVIGPGLRVSGAVLTDQTQSVDFMARRARYLGEAPAELVAQALARLASIIEG